MAQGRAEQAATTEKEADAGEKTRRFPSNEQLRRAAFVTEISDKDYRCVWRPCHEFEEEGEDENSGEDEGEETAE